jgi:quercetin dioxygenase-like cupin family protein
MLMTRGDKFDARNITWHTLEGIENLEYHIYAVDEALKIVDVMFKFAANKKVVLHRHHADYITLVIQGELRIYRANGELKEVRPVGSYVATRAGGEPHFDGAGEVDAIAFFSNRGQDGVIYEILDDDLNTLATLGLQDFKALMEAQPPQ